jgi:hypothetical protein
VWRSFAGPERGTSRGCGGPDGRTVISLRLCGHRRRPNGAHIRPNGPNIRPGPRVVAWRRSNRSQPLASPISPKALTKTHLHLLSSSSRRRRRNGLRRSAPGRLAPHPRLPGPPSCPDLRPRGAPGRGRRAPAAAAADGRGPLGEVHGHLHPHVSSLSRPPLLRSALLRSSRASRVRGLNDLSGESVAGSPT